MKNVLFSVEFQLETLEIEILDLLGSSIKCALYIKNLIFRRTDKIGTGVLSAKAVPIAKYIRRAQAFWRCFLVNIWWLLIAIADHFMIAK